MRPILAAVVANAAVGTLFAWSVLLTPVGAAFDVPPAGVAPVFSTAIVAFTLAVLQAGPLVSRHGPRRVVTAAGLLAGAGLATGAVATSLLVLAVGLGVGFGAASGLVYSAAVTATTLRSGRHRGGAVGAVVAAYAAGPVIAAPLGAWGAEAVGWRATLLAAALIVPTAVVLAARGLPHRSPVVRGGPVRASAQPPGGALAWLWLLFLCSVTPALFAFAFAAPVAAAAGAAPAAAGGAVALMAGGNLLGRLAAGPLADHLGVPAGLRMVVAAQAVALIAAGWSTDMAVVVAALALLAGAYGAVSALLPLATADLVPPAAFATSYGRVFTSWGVAGVLGPLAGAALADGSGGYPEAFRACLVVAVFAGVALAGVERADRQARGRQPRSAD